MVLVQLPNFRYKFLITDRLEISVLTERTDRHTEDEDIQFFWFKFVVRSQMKEEEFALANSRTFWV
jgi:hypothetical protein